MGNVRIRSGDLDRRISIFAVMERQDGAGEPVLVDVPWACDIAAQRLENRRKQVFNAASDQEAADLKFRIRYREGISGQDKLIVVSGAERFEVTAVMEFGRRVGFDLICQRLGGNI